MTIQNYKSYIKLTGANKFSILKGCIPVSPSPYALKSQAAIVRDRIERKKVEKKIQSSEHLVLATPELPRASPIEADERDG